MNGYCRAMFALLGAAVIGQASPSEAAPQAGPPPTPSRPTPQVFLGPAAYIRVVTDKDNGGSFTLPPDTSLIIRLRANPSTGYAWNVVMPPNLPLTLSGTPRYTPGQVAPGIVGAGGVQEFGFQPKYLPGITQTFYLRLLSLRPFSKGVAKAPLWEIKVTLPPDWTPPPASVPAAH